MIEEIWPLRSRVSSRRSNNNCGLSRIERPHGPTPMSLAGKTLFITGASRGIGKAIGLSAASEGANVVVVGKTDRPHPKLPGTVHSAAEEIRAAGGQALACVCDVRSEDQVERAVEATIDRFGRIDALINNASAIHLAGTLDTEMKRFDLMHRVNVRATFLCAQKCLPHLLSVDNPHILNISPPLNMVPKWFGPHVAYTMSKYGMSMCVLGMAESSAGGASPSMRFGRARRSRPRPSRTFSAARRR